MELERLVAEEGGRRGGFTGGIVASVVPPLVETFREAARDWLGLELSRLPSPEALGIALRVDEPASVGEDRIANTVAVARLHRTDAIVVDLGTATTFDVISAAGEFLGGVIAPGVRSGAEQLFRRTALLPRVAESLPERVIGRTTAECLRAGIYTGTVAMIEGLVARILEEWGRPRVRVIATGGLSGFLRGATAAVHEIDESLTLRGLAEAWTLAEREPRAGG
jgi:type III pantothenate kinase